MRRRAPFRVAFVALFALAGGVIVSARAATDGGTGGACSLPPMLTVSCMVDADCAIYNAICNQRSQVCACAVVDMATTGGADSGSGGSGGTGGAGGGFTGGGQGAQPIHGGGQVFPAREGCSYIPGSR